MTIKVVPKAACDFENCSYVRWRNSTNESEGKPEQKLMKLTELLLEIVSVLKARLNV